MAFLWADEDASQGHWNGREVLRSAMPTVGAFLQPSHPQYFPATLPNVLGPVRVMLTSPLHPPRLFSFESGPNGRRIFIVATISVRPPHP